MARSQIQNLEGLIMGALHGGMDKMKLEGQFRAGGDDRTKIIKHEHSAEVVSRFDGYFRGVPILKTKRRIFYTDGHRCKDCPWTAL
jgi:hypothetical protein